MTCALHVAWDEKLARYDFGAGHPMAPLRVKLTVELARAFGVLSASGVTVAPPPPATDAELALVHDPAYIEMVRQAGHWAAAAVSAHAGASAGRDGDAERLRRAALLFGLGTEDDPIFPGMHEASALAAGATLAAARAVWSGDALHGASIAGGLHHAMRSSAAGSASTTTRPSPSPGCCSRVPSGSPTWTLTCTTATACRRRSGTTRGC